MIYLDHNATSPYAESVKEFIQEEMVNKWANPSSEYVEGAVLSDEIKLIRAQIADGLGCSPKGLIFTSGATESINTVLSQANLKKLGVTNIVSSSLEHHATLDRLKFLETEGFKIHWIENDQEGRLNLTQIENCATNLGHCLFTFLYVNNEIGTINPIKEISSIVRKHGHLVHIDAVQALGKLRLNLEEIDVDFASFSGHKIGAFKGIGLLYCSEIKNLVPLVHGGGQERGYRPGTLNYAGIKSFELALNDAKKWDLEKIQANRDYLEKKIKDLGEVSINATLNQRVCNTSNIALKGKSSKEILSQLSRKDIFISTGSACSSGSFEPSHVIKALGFDKQYASSCIRVSISNSTTKEDIETLIENLKQVFTY